MDEELISIGKMAELNRVSVPTLRLYDEKGLLKPRYTDPQTGYRYYSIDQNARLDMIVYMKELGMSLAQIAQALEKEDISLIEELLSRKNEQIHQQIRQLKAQHDAVERAILSIERYRKSPVTGTLSLEYIDRRYVWGIPCLDNFYSRDNPEMLAEDARKFYVAISRARRRLYVSYCTTRRDGHNEPHRQYLTRFMMPLQKLFGS